MAAKVDYFLFLSTVNHCFCETNFCKRLGLCRICFSGEVVIKKKLQLNLGLELLYHVCL